MILNSLVSVEICVNSLNSQHDLNSDGAKFFHMNLNMDQTNIIEYHNTFDSVSIENSFPHKKIPNFDGVIINTRPYNYTQKF